MIDIQKLTEIEKYDLLKSLLKSFKHNPPTGFGQVVYEIDCLKDEVTLVTVSTKNRNFSQK